MNTVYTVSSPRQSLYIITQAHSHSSPVVGSDIDLQARKQQKLLLAI